MLQYEEQVNIKFFTWLDKFSQTYNMFRDAYGDKAMGQAAADK
jgi:hypothetical protein